MLVPVAEQATATRCCGKTHNINSHLTAVYLGQPGELVPELSETLTQYTTFIVLKFLKRTSNLPSQASHYTTGV